LAALGKLNNVSFIVGWPLIRVDWDTAFGLAKHVEINEEMWSFNTTFNLVAALIVLVLGIPYLVSWPRRAEDWRRSSSGRWGLGISVMALAWAIAALAMISARMLRGS
jgi:hypothetical protein